MNVEVNVLEVRTLSWDILKAKVRSYAGRLLGIQQKVSPKVDLPKPSLNSKSQCTSSGRVVLARRGDSGYYEVIVPFEGKVLVEVQTFDLLYRPLDPAAHALSESGSRVCRQIFQQYCENCHV